MAGKKPDGAQLSLATFIRAKAAINEADLETILSHFNELSIKKGKFLLKEGRQADQYFFVASGSFRLYFKNKDKQITGWIAMEGSFVTDLRSIRSNQSTRFNIQAVEDSVVLSIRSSNMELLYKKIPAWQEFGRKVWEDAFLGLLESIIADQTMTAEERYIKMMSDSDLLNRIPLKHLSSYLGITPTSLSRLRRKIK